MEPGRRGGQGEPEPEGPGLGHLQARHAGQDIDDGPRRADFRRVFRAGAVLFHEVAESLDSRDGRHGSMLVVLGGEQVSDRRCEAGELMPRFAPRQRQDLVEQGREPVIIGVDRRLDQERRYETPMLRGFFEERIHGMKPSIGRPHSRRGRACGG